jgi:hypothetical protein
VSFTTTGSLLRPARAAAGRARCERTVRSARGPAFLQAAGTAERTCTAGVDRLARRTGVTLSGEFIRLQCRLGPGTQPPRHPRRKARRRNAWRPSRTVRRCLAGSSLWEHGGVWHRGLLSTGLDRHAGRGPDRRAAVDRYGLVRGDRP